MKVLTADAPHGWIHVHEFPRGCFTPVCSCGWLDAERWFPTREAALESECGRQKLAAAS